MEKHSSRENAMKVNIDPGLRISSFERGSSFRDLLSKDKPDPTSLTSDLSKGMNDEDVITYRRTERHDNIGSCQD